jgi:hypothetical protein
LARLARKALRARTVQSGTPRTVAAQAAPVEKVAPVAMEETVVKVAMEVKAVAGPRAQSFWRQLKLIGPDKSI